MTREEAKEKIKSFLSYMQSLDADEEEKKDIEALRMAIEALEQTEWISVKDRLPVCEEKVLVQAIRTFRGGDTMTIITTGMYEDGTISECDSRWNWEDVDYEKWDDENDCMIIPKGWFEDKAYNPDGALNYQIDDEVVAWMPLPSPYKGE